MPLRRRQQDPPLPQSEAFTDSDEINDEDDEDMLEGEEMMGDEVELEDEEEGEDEEEPLGKRVDLFSNRSRAAFHRLRLFTILNFPCEISICIRSGPWNILSQLCRRVCRFRCR